VQAHRWLATISLVLVFAPSAHAQSVKRDTPTRLERFGRAVVYGSAMGLAYSAMDQMNDEPAEWGRDWNGYGKRVASNVGEFVIQESVTDGLAAIMKRPLDYTRCRCGSTTKRIGWALWGAVTDQMPNGTHPLAVPRIVGSYAGAYAQSTWRPDSRDRLMQTLINGSTSIAVGGLINLYHEFKHR